MKFLFLLLSGALLFITACNNKKNASGSGETISADTTATPAQQQKEEMLQGLTAYTPQQVEAMLPAELAGAAVSDKSSGKENGTAYARAAYAPSDTVSLGLTIYDCGGGEGAGFYKYQFVDKVNATEPAQVTNFKGDKAIEEYNDDSYRSTFTYISGRFMVILESESLDMAGLKKIAGGLSIK